VNHIINGRRALTASVAVRLAREFDMSPEFWLGMQQAVDLYRAKQELEAAAS
jgi:addiction module HigA family antidote